MMARDVDFLPRVRFCSHQICRITDWESPQQSHYG